MSEAEDDPAKIAKESDFVGAWLQELDDATTQEKDWRDDADKASKAYRGVKESGNTSFNIFHANIETIVPALYNSVPVPDVRRRYQDEDPVGKVVADLLERSLALSTDSYDFDDTMLNSVKDMEVAGRGQARVRYQANFAQDNTVGYEKAFCEHVTWLSFRRGPAKAWAEVPWVAFEHFLSKPDIEAKAGEEIAKAVPYTFSANAKDGKDEKDSTPRFGKRAQAWEVWDLASRKVHFISPQYGERRLWTVDDPLSLEQFFPVPRPLQAIRVTDSLVPVTPLSIYEELVVELNDLTTRIRRLVKSCRVRGGYASLNDDIKAIAEAGDTELVPLTGAEFFLAEGKKLEDAIVWWPIEQIVKALAQLVQQRELVKQTIYEVTKIADVMRGATNPNETLGAQQLKAQWGSLAVQRSQMEVARFARDLFRLKAEIMANKFSMQSLMMMTGIQLPTQEQKMAVQSRMQAPPPQPQPTAMPGAPPAPQPAPPQPSPEDQKILATPTVEEVEKMLRQDAVRNFHVDIESDSTIRGDLSRSQQQMTAFIGGLAQYVAAVGPMVEKGIMPPDIAIELLAAFARQYKLGKQAEDTLARWADKIRAMANKPQPEKPDPKEIEAQVKMALAKLKMQEAQEKAALDAQAMQMDAQAKQAEHQYDMEKLGAEVQADQVKTANQIALQRAKPPPPQYPQPGAQ